jgi:DNA (cytosine-5)-methyltransferase 1
VEPQINRRNPPNNSIRCKRAGDCEGFFQSAAFISPYACFESFERISNHVWLEQGEGGELKVLSLFSGIGGLDLAAEWAGMQTVAFCEIEPYAIQVLERSFPNVPIYKDVRTLTAKQLEADGITVDVVVGGFPCQDLSCAGKQAGLEGERSGLWFEMLRIISEVRPRWVVAENVRGAVNIALDTCRMGLEGEGYEVRSYVIPASSAGAPHKRERLFIVAYRNE